MVTGLLTCDQAVLLPFLFGRRKSQKRRSPDRRLTGDQLELLHPLFILSFPENVDNIHLMATFDRAIQFRIG